MTPAQFRSQFGPAPDAAAKVERVAARAGMKVSALQQNGRYFNVTGSVGSAQKAFGTKLSLYRRAGGTYQAPAGRGDGADQRQPDVLSVTGLDEAPATVSPKRGGRACCRASTREPEARSPRTSRWVSATPSRVRLTGAS